MHSAETKSKPSNVLQRKSDTPFFQAEESREAFFGPETQSETSFFQSAPPSIQAKCDACEQEEQVQRKEELEEQTTPEIQPKLTIGAPDDPYEKQADAVADQVVQRLAQTPSAVGTTSNAVQPKTAEPQEEQIQEKSEDGEQEGERLQMKPIFESTPPPDDAAIQRACASCEEEQNSTVQRKESGGETTASPNLSSRLASSRGSGSPLPADTKTQMEGAMGADFSGVRVHTGSDAADMSQGIHAHAFTHGSDIYFNKGKYDPGSTDGQRLLAHELVHTVQQGGGRHSNTSLQQKPQVLTKSSDNLIQKSDALYQEKVFLINEVNIHGDNFRIEFLHNTIDKRVTAKILYTGQDDYIYVEFITSTKNDDRLSQGFNSATHNLVLSPIVSNSIVTYDLFLYLTSNQSTTTIVLSDEIVLNKKWIPNRHTHTFYIGLDKAEMVFHLPIDNNGMITGMKTGPSPIEIIPKNALPANASVSEFEEIEVPDRPELSSEQALMAVKIKLQEFLDKNSIYNFGPIGLATLISRVDHIMNDKSAGDQAVWATGMLRVADMVAQKVPSLSIFMLPGYFPEVIAKEADALVSEIHILYEKSLYQSANSLKEANDSLKRAEEKINVLQFRLTNLFLRNHQGGLTALEAEISGLAQHILEFRHESGTTTRYPILEQKYLRIGRVEKKYDSITVQTHGATQDIDQNTEFLRKRSSEADPSTFSKVMQTVALARQYKGLASMLATYSLFKFYSKGYHGAASWTIDAVLPGSGETKVDGYINSIGSLLDQIESKLVTEKSLSEEFLNSIFSNYTKIVGNENFQKDIEFIINRLESINTIKAVIKGIVIVIIAALGAAIMGPAAGAAAAEMGLGATGVGLVAFGAEVLAFTTLNQLGQQLVFGRTDLGFFEELIQNAIFLGALKLVARLHRGVFALAKGDPKLYPKLFATTGAAASLISLQGLGAVQFRLKKSRWMTAEEHGWMVVQNLALMGALALGNKITRPIREQLEMKTYEALATNAQKKLTILDANRAMLAEEIATVRKLGNSADPVRRQKLINDIEKQFNSDVEWFKEALRIKKIPQSQGKVYIERYREYIQKLQISLAEYGFDFNPGGERFVRVIEPGVIAYKGDAFKTLGTDAITGEQRSVKELSNGMYEVQVGEKRFLYVPESDLPVNLADLQGVRALVEYYKYDWEATKSSFGSDGSTAMNSLLAKAWGQGWRPGKPIPENIKTEIFDYYEGDLSKKFTLFEQQVRSLPDIVFEQPEIILPQGEGEIMILPRSTMSKADFLKPQNIKVISGLLGKWIEEYLPDVDPGIRRALVSLYTTKTKLFLESEANGEKDTAIYPSKEDLLNISPLIEKGGLHKYPELIELLMTDRLMRQLLLEFGGNPDALLTHYETYLQHRESGRIKTQSFKTYGQRYLFPNEFKQAQNNLDKIINEEKLAAKQEKIAKSGKDTRSLKERFGSEWLDGNSPRDNLNNNALLYRESEPDILESFLNQKLPSQIQTQLEVTMKGDLLSRFDPNEAESYSKARTKVVGVINYIIVQNIKTFSDYSTLIDLAIQSGTRGTIGEGYVKANEIELGIPSGGIKKSVELNQKMMNALDKARLGDGLEAIFTPNQKRVIIDLFYSNGNIIAEVKVGSSFDLLQFKKYATLMLYQTTIKGELQIAGIQKIDKIFYIILPDQSINSQPDTGVDPSKQAEKIKQAAHQQNIKDQTDIRFITKDGQLFDQTDIHTNKFIKKVK